MANCQEPLKIIAGAADKPLKIGDIEIPCYVLEDETRVITKKGLVHGIGSTQEGVIDDPRGAGEIPRFVAQNWLQPFISEDLWALVKFPIEFILPTGGIGHGYPATVLAEICSAIVEAYKQGATTLRESLKKPGSDISKLFTSPVATGFLKCQITAKGTCSEVP